MSSISLISSWSIILMIATLRYGRTGITPRKSTGKARVTQIFLVIGGEGGNNVGMFYPFIV
jgi:hypothetical protein